MDFGEDLEDRKIGWKRLFGRLPEDAEQRVQFDTVRHVRLFHERGFGGQGLVQSVTERQPALERYRGHYQDLRADSES